MRETNSIDELVSRSIIKIEGEVSFSKEYILAEEFTLQELIGVAGGLTSLANPNLFYVTTPTLSEDNKVFMTKNELNSKDKIIRFGNVKLGSIIRIGKIETEFSLGTVKISGQVFQPGSYQIFKDETIFSILKIWGFIG